MDTSATIRDFGSLSSVVRALNLLEFVGQSGRRGLAEIAAFTGLPKSTLLRLIGTLVENGFLQRTNHGEYGIGMKLWRIGCTAIDLENMRDVIIPILRRLTQETAETSLYAVYDGGKAVYVEKVEGLHPIRAYANVGSHSPAYASATGKALLAFRPAEEIAAVGDAAEPLTTATRLGADELLRHAAEIRRVGYAVNRGEWRNGVWGIAAPVFARERWPIAAIGVSGPRERIEANLACFADMVLRAARDLSASHGATSRPAWPMKGMVDV